MNPPVVIIGIGELGGVFAKAFLKHGSAVYPVTRKVSMEETRRKCPEPALAIVAVREDQLSAILSTLPEKWKSRVCLIQNELLPGDWKKYHIADPTVISVWFEKKKGMDVNPIRSSPVFGPGSVAVHGALAEIGIPSRILADEKELLFELVAKNVFVFTINIAGLKTGGTVGNLWSRHRDLAVRIARDVMDVQESVTGVSLSSQRLTEALAEGIMGDPSHRCTGRAAPMRLERIRALADEAGLAVPAIREIEKAGFE